jgi:riboflavin synthase alpha subunit
MGGDVFGGREELVEVKFQISQDQKKWLEKMVKEGKIAVPPGGSLSVGNVISMFIRALLHNAMEQQQAIEREEKADEDDE